MINSNANTPIQAVPLLEGKVNLGTGTYQTNGLIHAETDAAITFGAGNTPYSMLAGSDRAYSGFFTVTSGTVTID